RDRFAWADKQGIPGEDLLDRDVKLVPVADDASGLGLELDQLANRAARLRLGTRFQSLAKDDEGDHDGRDVKVHSPSPLRKKAGEQRAHGGVEPSRAGAKSDQRVHVCVVVLEAVPGS